MYFGAITVMSAFHGEEWVQGQRPANGPSYSSSSLLAAAQLWLRGWSLPDQM